LARQNRLKERLLKTLDELEITKNQLIFWTDSIEELSEVQDAFSTEDKAVLSNKSVLDIGTDCIKPFYLALKFKPKMIIGIDEELLPFGSEIQRGSRLLTDTKIRFYNCSLFNKKKLEKIFEKEHVDRFDFVLTSKTLHHLRTGQCITEKRNKKHKCSKDEKDCVYKFDEQKVFSKLLALGKRVVVYECFAPDEKDDDKTGGKGGYFSVKEWKRIISYLITNYEVNFIRPRLLLSKDEILSNLDSILREVDTICFYVEDNKTT
jgi:hypothetical protein